MVIYKAHIRSPTFIDLPLSLCNHSAGITIDFGSSLIKVAVLDDKSTSQNESDIAKGMKRVRLRIYQPTELDQVISDLSHAAAVSHDQVVHITGNKAAKYATELEEKFKIKTKIIPDVDCKVTAFTQLTRHFSKDTVLLEDLPEPTKEAQDYLDRMKGMLMKMNEHVDAKLVMTDKNKNTNDAPSDGTLADVFPCLLVSVGSSVEALKISKDGQVELVNASPRCGGSMMGLGFLLTGATSYDELTEIATRGNDKDVSSYMSDVIAQTDTDDAKSKSTERSEEAAKKDIYDEFADGHDDLAFLYGKAVTKDKAVIPRESLATSLVLQFATDIGQFVHESVALAGTSRVFFCGNFYNADIVRGEICKQVILRDLVTLIEDSIDFKFMKHGGFLAAIGALIHGSSS